MTAKRYVFITGASSGIGFQFARYCAQRGDTLLLVSRSAERLQKAADHIRTQYAADVLTLSCDLTQPSAVAEVMEWLDALQVVPRLIIHNAGFGAFGAFHQLPEESIEDQIAIHDLFPLRFTRRILPRLLEAPPATILFIASTAAFAPVPFLNVYAAAKALQLHSALALRAELDGTGVQVSCCCPGPVATGFFDTAQMSNRPPFPLRLMDPETVVRYTMRQLERGKALIIPGVLNRWIARFSRWMPKTTAARIAASLYRRQLNKRK